MDEIAKVYRHEWRGELPIFYGRRADGSETALELPPGALTFVAAGKLPVQQKGEGMLAAPVLVNSFEVGSMPVEAELLVTLTVNTALGPRLLFACLVERRSNWPSFCKTRLGKPLPHKDALRRSASSRLWFFLTPDKKRGVTTLPVDWLKALVEEQPIVFWGVGF